MNSVGKQIQTYVIRLWVVKRHVCEYFLLNLVENLHTYRLKSDFSREDCFLSALVECKVFHILFSGRIMSAPGKLL
ncbi:hypothetical protein X975_03849, partial [Stegodyphus mimosarum]